MNKPIIKSIELNIGDGVKVTLAEAEELFTELAKILGKQTYSVSQGSYIPTAWPYTGGTSSAGSVTGTTGPMDKSNNCGSPLYIPSKYPEDRMAIPIGAYIASNPTTSGRRIGDPGTAVMNRNAEIGHE